VVSVCDKFRAPSGRCLLGCQTQSSCAFRKTLSASTNAQSHNCMFVGTDGRLAKRFIMQGVNSTNLLLCMPVVKGKGHLITGYHGAREEVEVMLYPFSTSALGGSGWSAPRPGRLTPGKDPAPFVQEAG
jgi:hypothetical protein